MDEELARDVADALTKIEVALGFIAEELGQEGGRPAMLFRLAADIAHISGRIQGRLAGRPAAANSDEAPPDHRLPPP